MGVKQAYLGRSMKFILQVINNIRKDFKFDCIPWKIPRNYHNEQDLTQAIKEKQKKYETSSMSSVEEKKLLKDIDFLKKALPDMQKLSLITPQLN